MGRSNKQRSRSHFSSCDASHIELANTLLDGLDQQNEDCPLGNFFGLINEDTLGPLELADMWCCMWHEFAGHSVAQAAFYFVQYQAPRCLSKSGLIGMCTERLQTSLKMFVVGDPPKDKEWGRDRVEDICDVLGSTLSSKVMGWLSGPNFERFEEEIVESMEATIGYLIEDTIGLDSDDLWWNYKQFNYSSGEVA